MTPDNTRIAWITACATIGAGSISVAYQHLSEVFYKPKLCLEFDPVSSMCIVENRGEDDHGNFDDRYVRVRLRNTGLRVAKGCVVYLTAIEEIHASNKATPTSFTEAIQLSWPLNDYGTRNIPNGADFYVDLVKMYSRAPGWNFGIKELYSTHRPLQNHSGIYRFHLVATADNAEAANITIDVVSDGTVMSLRAYQSD